MKLAEYLKRLSNIEKKSITLDATDTDIDIAQYYRVDIEPDAINNSIYLNMGYDTRYEYDSGFSLPCNEAYKLATEILKVTNACSDANIIIEISRDFVNTLSIKLSKNEVTKLIITPVKLCEDTFDPRNLTQFSGNMIINILYSTIDDYQFSGYVVSDTFFISENHIPNVPDNEYFTNQYGIAEVYVDRDKWNELESELKQRYAQLEEVYRENYEKSKMQQELKPMENPDTEDMVANILAKMEMDTEN
jgi:hypothetical protein